MVQSRNGGRLTEDSLYISRLRFLSRNATYVSALRWQEYWN